MAVIGEEDLLFIPFRIFVYVVAGLPLCSLILCISLALMLHFDEANRTHCNVPNWLPSVSAIVASFSPEKYIWRIFIGLHSAPRFLVAFAFRNLLLSSPLRPLNEQLLFSVMCHIACALSIAENIFLLLLTSVSSSENYVMHKVSFVGFTICSLIYMIAASTLFHYSGRRRTSSLGELSFQYKVLMCFSSFLSVLTAVYFFYRHNAYCEPGIYSFFAISEYAFILSNIFFHSTLFFDFQGKRFVLISSGQNYQYHALLPLHNINKRS